MVVLVVYGYCAVCLLMRACSATARIIPADPFARCIDVVRLVLWEWAGHVLITGKLTSDPPRVV